ncbi:MAG: hypothetical protein KKA65_04080 [Nanoarchaeota archaeon]|nr:hypothetical protein [Nanoarchaeota archaeon]MBU4351837.1 hypothetical protein [Nanoarchaeota archaeon]MBU4456656.1 hypothetical protein [Nanoarchaeota archaeon]MCG2719799.1 hypothetical protein [Nanoarchaeota archaeon]
MRRDPRLFTDEEYSFLHYIFLKNNEETKIFKRIKQKKGMDLDGLEIKHVKRKYEKWRDSQDSENQILFVNDNSRRRF